MKNTTNYGLKKPDGTDAVDIAIINQNMDTIDARMKSNATQIDDLKNNKANTSHGNHVPATQSANNKKFLRCDNTWQDVTPGNIGAAPASHTHTKSQIIDFPTSLPANGGNADTVDGKHAIDFPLKSQGIGGNAPVWAGSNLNDIPIGTYTTLSTGVPVTGEYFLVTTRYNDTGKIKEQYALRQANGERYFRWFNGTAWSSWRNLDDYAPSYKSANGYWGICPVKGNDTGWIRTPSLGLLPYASGGGASAGSLGTSSWKFKEIHGVDIFANGVNVGTEINTLKSIVNKGGGDVAGKTYVKATKTVANTGNPNSNLEVINYTNSKGGVCKISQFGSAKMQIIVDGAMVLDGAGSNSYYSNHEFIQGNALSESYGELPTYPFKNNVKVVDRSSNSGTRVYTAHFYVNS